MKKVKVFISYRNTIVDNTYKNYNLLQNLVSSLQEQNPSCEFLLLPPEVIPKGTLFSPYDIAEFIHKTFLLIDDCDKFIILDKDYFQENGNLTSIWTEAEFCIWSYYDRNMRFSRFKTKDPFYTIATPSETGFLFSQNPLYNLSKQQRGLLRICALDFDYSAPGAPYYRPYMKTMKNLIAVCGGCQRLYTVEAKELRKLHTAEAGCSCGNKLHFTIEKKEKEYYVCSQTMQSTEPKRINIFEALRLLFEKKPVYEILELTGDRT
ncbi:MAG: hypothetical protein K2N94_07595 [Lachnospiraceae bacterium]|nr:hypothetical protein [Lachnospiraceae bacterium]